MANSLASKFNGYLRRHHKSNARCPWPPDGPAIQPGDYGLVEDGVFKRGPFYKLGNIESRFGVAVEIAEDSFSSFVLELSSSVSVDFELSQGLPSLPGTTASLQIDFAEEGAAVISGENSTVPTISNLGDVIDSLMDLKAAGKWDMDYRLVLAVRRLPSAFIAIAQTATGKLILGLKGANLPVLSELGKSAVSVSIGRESGGFFKAFDAKDVTPILYLGKLVRKGQNLTVAPAGLMGPESFEFSEDSDID